MGWIVWFGICFTLLGLSGIIYSIIAVMKLRRAKLSEEQTKAGLQKLLPINIGALGVSVIGLMAVIMGKSLG